MRFEIRELLKAQSITAIYVTHDQSEAMVISDVVLIMQHGRLIQAGAPKELYMRPKTRFVAEFFGRTNILAIDIAKSQAGLLATTNGLTFACAPGIVPRDDNLLGFRPENVEVVPICGDGQMQGVVTRAVYLGGGTQVDVVIAGVNITFMVSGSSNLEAGAAIAFRVAPEHLMVLEADADHE
jgi:ABC-type Fe3+/spermidine/putrescine transport system ATPase subunit